MLHSTSKNDTTGADTSLGTNGNVLIQEGSAKFEGSQSKLSLYVTYLTWKRNDGNQQIETIDLVDVIGATVHPKHREILLIHCCPFRNAKAKKERERKTFWFVFGDPKVAELWVTAVRAALQHTTSLTAELPLTRNLVLLSAKNGENAWQETKPMFEAANIISKVVESTHPGHCKAIAREIDIKKWNTIVCIGGDDLVNDLINGLMSRHDWKRAIKIPIAVIPVEGAPNVLSINIGSFDAVTAAYNAIKGKPRPVDVFSVLQGSASLQGSSVFQEKNKRVYGIVGIHWGIFSENDFDMDNKWMGGLRFKWNALRSVVTPKKSYTGRVSLYPASEWQRAPDNPLNVHAESQPSLQYTTSKLDWKQTAESTMEILNKERENRETNNTNQQSPSPSVEEKPDSHQSEELMEEIDLNEGSKDDPKSHKVVPTKVELHQPEPDEGNEETKAEKAEKVDQNNNSSVDSPSPSTGPTLSLWKAEDPFYVYSSNKWIVFTNEFLFFLACNLYTISGDKNTVTAPYAQMSDGYMDVIILRNANNIKVAKVISAMQNGTHIHCEGVEYYKVKGFSIEPTSEGTIKVDGESIKPYGPIRVEVHHALARIVCTVHLKYFRNH